MVPIVLRLQQSQTVARDNSDRIVNHLINTVGIEWINRLELDLEI